MDQRISIAQSSGGTNQNKGEQVCYRCGEPGHCVNNCTKKSNVCYNCKKSGHLARDCKTQEVELSGNAAKTMGKCQDVRGKVSWIDSEEAKPIRHNHQDHGHEKRQQMKPYHRLQENNQGDHRSVAQNDRSGEKGKQAKTGTLCFRCGGLGHYASKFPLKKELCFNCKKPGHYAKNCRESNMEVTANTVEIVHSTSEGRIYSLSRRESSSSEDFISGNVTIATHRQKSGKGIVCRKRCYI